MVSRLLGEFGILITSSVLLDIFARFFVPKIGTDEKFVNHVIEISSRLNFSSRISTPSKFITLK